MIQQKLEIMLQDTKQIHIETERLVLRRMRLEDASFILELLNTEGWLKYIGDRNVKTEQAAENYLREKVLVGSSMNGLGMLLVETKSEGKAIGICGLVEREGLDAPDIGFAFLPEHYGKGYAYESAVPVLRFAQADLGMLKVQAITIKENLSSIRLLEKLGMEFIKTIRIPNDEEELLLYQIQF